MNKQPNKFKKGKYYQRVDSNKILHILCKAQTFTYGECLIAEDNFGNLVPVGMTDDNTIGFYEVSGWHRKTYESNNIPEPTFHETLKYENQSNIQI